MCAMRSFHIVPRIVLPCDGVSGHVKRWSIKHHPCHSVSVVVCHGDACYARAYGEMKRRNFPTCRRQNMSKHVLSSAAVHCQVMCHDTPKFDMSHHVMSCRYKQQNDGSLAAGRPQRYVKACHVILYDVQTFDRYRPVLGSTFAW